MLLVFVIEHLSFTLFQFVKKHFGDKVYKTIIPRNIRMSEAPGFGKPIFLYDKDSEGAKKYKELTKEFLLFNAGTIV